MGSSVTAPAQGPVKAAEMFKVLLNDARSRDVIQSSFDILTDHLEGGPQAVVTVTGIGRFCFFLFFWLFIASL